MEKPADMIVIEMARSAVEQIREGLNLLSRADGEVYRLKHRGLVSEDQMRRMKNALDAFRPWQIEDLIAADFVLMLNLCEALLD